MVHNGIEVGIPVRSTNSVPVFNGDWVVLYQVFVFCICQKVRTYVQLGNV